MQPSGRSIGEGLRRLLASAADGVPDVPHDGSARNDAAEEGLPMRAAEPAEPQIFFEEFTSGPAWRSLPLKIKLLVVHLWRAERDVPPKSSD
jgi:hypothetical protein